jgi:hypothetical protein
VLALARGAGVLARLPVLTLLSAGRAYHLSGGSGLRRHGGG